MIRALIFDCFGVLLTDSMDAAMGVLQLTEQQKAQAKDIVTAANWGMMGSEEARAQIAAALNMSKDAWVDLLNRSEGRNTVLWQQILKLKKRYKTAMLSNIGTGGLMRRFSQEELDSLFDVVIASSEYGIAKPDERIYRITAEKLGVQTTECIFIDDRADFVTAAEMTGMHGIVYTDVGQCMEAINRLLADMDA